MHSGAIKLGDSWILCAERVHDRAFHMFVARALEGLTVWGILEWFYAPAIQQLWLARGLFLAYFLVNLALLIPQRRKTLNRSMLWLDIVANIAPMAAATHWSGGLYSPVLPIFVIKIGNYGLIYSVQTGVRALGATILLLGSFGLTAHLGFGPSAALHLVPEQTRQRLTLGFGAFLFGIGCYGALRFFRELSDRERRLAAALEEQQRLYAQLLVEQEQLRLLSQRLVEVSETTLQAVSRELHDDFGQAITAVRMDLNRVERELPPTSTARQQLRSALHQLANILQNVRNLSQILRPAVLDDLGLVAAIESYATRFSERTGVSVELQLPSSEPTLPPEIELTLYRVLQEALTNVARHARAHNVHITLERTEDRIRLSVRDDGKGFVVAERTAPPSGFGLGIAGMRERAQLYGGNLRVQSKLGEGTEVIVELPLVNTAEGDRERGVAQHRRATG
jgi:two-component system sensor histidine kinase NreB